jgi:hypothetical protein
MLLHIPLHLIIGLLLLDHLGVELLVLLALLDVVGEHADGVGPPHLDGADQEEQQPVELEGLGEVFEEGLEVCEELGADEEFERELLAVAF